MKFAIYVRVSTQEQTTDNQLIKLKEYADYRHWEYAVFEERESTRKTRPVKELVKKLLREGQFSGLIVWKLDRWGRSTSELVLELEEFTELGVNFVSVSDNIDLSTSIGRLVAHIFASFAEFERDLIRERTMLGLSRARAEGKRLGRPPGSKDHKVRRKSGYLLRWAGDGKKSKVATK